MGHLELFAQRTFAEETERITGGAAGWQDPPEIRLEEAQSDGFLVIRRPHLLERLAAPWPEAQAHSEVMLELKLAGDHLDRMAVERALLRRQARQVQRVEELDSWLGNEPLWLVASHLPEWLARMRRPVCFAPGCYWIDPPRHTFLWIAANELPLRDERIPFLMARSGHALDGQLDGAPAALRQVLAGRQLSPIRDEDARIDACTDLATLRRWIDQAITAVSISDALK